MEDNGANWLCECITIVKNLHNSNHPYHFRMIGSDSQPRSTISTLQRTLMWDWVPSYWTERRDKILPLSNFFSPPFVIFNRNLQWTFQCHLMMNNHLILFANEMPTLQTLKDCNYIGIHKAFKSNPKRIITVVLFGKQINYSYPAPKYTPPDDY